MSPVGIVVRRYRPPVSSVGAVATCVVVVIVVVSPSSRHGVVVSRGLLLMIVLLSVSPRRRPLLLLSSLVCSCPGHTHPARGSSFSICRPSSLVVVVCFSRLLLLAVVRLHCRPSFPSAVFLTVFAVSALQGVATARALGRRTCVRRLRKRGRVSGRGPGGICRAVSVEILEGGGG